MSNGRFVANTRAPTSEWSVQKKYSTLSVKGEKETFFVKRNDETL